MAGIEPGIREIKEVVWVSLQRGSLPGELDFALLGLERSMECLKPPYKGREVIGEYNCRSLICRSKSGFDSLHFPRCSVAFSCLRLSFHPTEITAFALQATTLIQPPAWMFLARWAPQVTSHLHFHPGLFPLYFFKKNFLLITVSFEQSLDFYSFLPNHLKNTCHFSQTFDVFNPHEILLN